MAPAPRQALRQPDGEAALLQCLIEQILWDPLSSWTQQWSAGPSGALGEERHAGGLHVQSPLVRIHVEPP